MIKIWIEKVNHNNIIKYVKHYIQHIQHINVIYVQDVQRVDKCQNFNIFVVHVLKIVNIKDIISYVPMIKKYVIVHIIKNVILKNKIIINSYVLKSWEYNIKNNINVSNVIQKNHFVKDVYYCVRKGMDNGWKVKQVDISNVIPILLQINQCIKVVIIYYVKIDIFKIINLY